MPISSLYSDTYTDISQWGTGLGEEDYPTIGWEEGQWDDPATEEVETTPGMDYWLDFLAGESADSGMVSVFYGPTCRKWMAMGHG